MAVKIPKDFNYKKMPFDDLEESVRDKYKVNIENWAKFRHTITASVNSNSLHSLSPISDVVKSSYVELSKSHYEVVTMLGATKLSLDKIIKSEKGDQLIFKKSFKEFYMHAGSVLDNLARLIYIVNVSESITKGDTKYGRFVLKRHDMGYGSLAGIYKNKKSELKGYSNIIKSKVINEIKTVRNNFTHSWPPVLFVNPTSKELFWPTAMRKKEQYYLWPHDPNEKKKIKIQYRKRVSIVGMIKNDWKEIEKFQNAVFKKLTKDICKFERNHNLIIK